MQHNFPIGRRVLQGITLAAAVASSAAMAQAWPTKPISLVVPFAAGGTTDVLARALGERLSRALGQPVIIESKPGAGATIGADYVAKAKPDGYTLLVGANNEVAINRLVTSAVKYKLTDFTPIGMIASQPLVLVASTNTGVKTIGEFLQRTKANPGKFSYGSSGVGTSLHLAGEMVKEQAGVFLTHIPYRGVAPLANDLLGGNLEYGVFVLSSGLPHIRSGKVVALGTTEAKRSAVTPDIPALAEHPALKGIDISTWFVLMGPAKMPEPVVARLKKALADTLQSPEFRKKMEAASSTVPTTPVDIQKFLVDETAKYQKIVDFAKIKE